MAFNTKEPVGGCFDVTERVTLDDILFPWPPRIGGYPASCTRLSVRVMPLFRPPGWSTARDLLERDAEAQDAHYDRFDANGLMPGSKRTVAFDPFQQFLAILRGFFQIKVVDTEPFLVSTKSNTVLPKTNSVLPKRVFGKTVSRPTCFPTWSLQA